MYVCVFVCLSFCLSACLPAWLAGWLAVCMYVCMYVCIYMYVHAYIYTVIMSKCVDTQEVKYVNKQLHGMHRHTQTQHTCGLLGFMGGGVGVGRKGVTL